MSTVIIHNVHCSRRKALQVRNGRSLSDHDRLTTTHLTIIIVNFVQDSEKSFCLPDQLVDYLLDTLSIKIGITVIRKT